MAGVPFPSSKWDEIIPNLFQGGHDWNNADDIWNSDVIVADEFDVVFSLFQRAGHGPAEGVEHHHLRIPDGFLQEQEVAEVRKLADLASVAVQDGRRTLVRCQAGLNRSGLVVAFVLLRLGWEPTKALTEIRYKRSAWALHNEHFITLIFAEAVRLDRVAAEAVA